VNGPGEINRPDRYSLMRSRQLFLLAAFALDPEPDLAAPFVAFVLLTMDL
jgi:hypothetical protein